MGMIRPSRSSRLHPRRCPPRNPPLSPQHGPMMVFLTGGPAPPGLLLGPPAQVPPPPAVVTGPPSQVRQNYHPECEAAINKQINLELYASYVYLSIAFYFDRQDVAVTQFATFFLWQSREEREQAQMLMRLQNQRGGRIRFRDIRRPDRCHWGNGLMAMKYALHVERIVNQSLLSLFHLATNKNDVHLCDFLEHLYLSWCVKFIGNFGASIINLRRMGAPESGLAEYLFGKLTLNDRTEPGLSSS